jgi:hypothetical protein
MGPETRTNQPHPPCSILKIDSESVSFIRKKTTVERRLDSPSAVENILCNSCSATLFAASGFQPNLWQIQRAQSISYSIYAEILPERHQQGLAFKAAKVPQFLRTERSPLVESSPLPTSKTTVPR